MASSRSHFPLALAAASLLLLGAPVLAEEHEGEDTEAMGYPAADEWQLPEPDTSNWRCRNCPFADGLSGSIEVGAGNVSDDSFEFGDYRGLEEEGGFAVLEGDVLYRGDNGGYLDFLGEDLGLDSRSARIEGGHQGTYGIWLEYDQLPHYLSNDTRTVFRGTGSADLTLPGSWVRADTTGGMTELDASLREIDIEQERESIGAGFDLLAGSRWRFNVEAREDTLEGNRVQGGSFLFDSALLPAPVDYKTERVDASVAYVRERWRLEAAFHTSNFTNENESLRWDNPFLSASGADQGQIALAPDNQFNQVSLAGSWRSRGTLTVAGRLAVGRAEQDEDFLAPTTNTALGAPALPREDLDGEVDTRAFNLRVTGNPAERLTAGAEIYYDERDNDTPRDDFTQVVTDSVLGSSETNTPYSYDRTGAEATLDYRVSRDLTLGATVGHERMDRDFQASAQTDTDEVSVEVRGRPDRNVSMRLRQTLEWRDGNYDVSALPAGENPALRSFHLADRDRRATELGMSLLFGDGASLGISAEVGNDEYSDTEVGLTDSEFQDISFDLSAAAAEGVMAYAFLGLQRIDSEVAGVDNLASTSWVADQVDQYETLGTGVEVADLPGKWTRGVLNLTYAEGRSRIEVDKGLGDPAFPDLKTQRLTLELFADRRIRKDLDLRVGYLVEDLRQDDFYIDQVNPDTIPSVLTLGDESADDTVHVIQASVRYEF